MPGTSALSIGEDVDKVTFIVSRWCFTLASCSLLKIIKYSAEQFLKPRLNYEIGIGFRVTRKYTMKSFV